MLCLQDILAPTVVHILHILCYLHHPSSLVPDRGADSFSITFCCPLESWVESIYLSALSFVWYESLLCRILEHSVSPGCATVTNFLTLVWFDTGLALADVTLVDWGPGNTLAA